LRARRALIHLENLDCHPWSGPLLEIDDARTGGGISDHGVLATGLHQVRSRNRKIVPEMRGFRVENYQVATIGANGRKAAELPA
jgi:hypothetical protein